jgi:hypothetical protein
MVTITGQWDLDDATTSTQTSTVGEPSVAASSTAMLVTGNWYASYSGDAGRTWTFVDPFTHFPTDRGRFCCDQLVHYSTRARLWVWLLQYEAVGGANIIRVATSRTGAPGSWRWRDIAPTDIDPSWTGVWFDYPDLAESDGHLWISSNVYDTSDRWRRAVVFRYDMKELAKDGAANRRSWSTQSVGSLRLVAGAGDTMWFAGSDSVAGVVRLFAWPDASEQVATWSVRVSPWNDSDYASAGPGGGPWLSRVDDRITGAWRAGGRLGFLWTAGRNAAAGRPHPFIKAVTLDESTLAVVAEPDLWSATGAWAYPAAAPNRRGRIGLSAFFGGGTTQPAYAVGVLDQDTNTWSTAKVATSTDAPSNGKWGDYVVCRPHPRRPTSWVASGFTLEGGVDRRNIVPHVAVFRA